MRSKRAFLHLQRLLAVDADIRAKWKGAFEAEHKGELSCEKLGAVHLLCPLKRRMNSEVRLF